MPRRALLVPMLLLAACSGAEATGTLHVEPRGHTDFDASGEGAVNLELDGRGGPTVEIIFFESSARTSETSRSRFAGDTHMRRETTGGHHLRIVNTSNEPARIHYAVRASSGVEVRSESGRPPAKPAPGR